TQAIEIQGLRKTYRTAKGGAHEALKGVDLQVSQGHVYGFVGVNGAGKSTLIKSLVGLLQTDGGTATVFGCEAGSVKAREHIGYLPEVSNFHEFLTARELLKVHSVLAGVSPSDRKERCLKALELVGLAARQDARISEFSKGMKQRFGIAQAMVSNPSLLVLDELTSGLDPLAQRELKNILTTLRGQGSTIFFSSHHMSEVEAICDRVAIIHGGLIRAEGTMDELLTQPGSLELTYRGGEEMISGLASRSAGDGLRTVTIPEARCPEVIDALRASNTPIVELKAARVTLEELYFRVVDEANRKDT
ncbi:unnamed protein product, partial [Phaeothamnion confervicola]